MTSDLGSTVGGLAGRIRDDTKYKLNSKRFKWKCSHRRRIELNYLKAGLTEKSPLNMLPVVLQDLSVLLS